MRHKYLIVFIFFLLGACAEDPKKQTDFLQLFSVEIGDETLNLSDFTQNTDIPFDQPILINFSAAVDVRTGTAVTLTNSSGSISFDLDFINENKTLSLTPDTNLPANELMTLHISDDLAGAIGEVFDGIEIEFTTIQSSFTVASVIIDGQTATSSNRVKDVDRNPVVQITFPIAVNPATVNNETVKFQGNTIIPTLSFSFSEGNTKVTVTSTQTLDHLSRYTLNLSSAIDGAGGEIFTPYTKYFYTEIDPTPNLPLLANDEDS